MDSLQKCNPYAMVLKMRIANYATFTNLKPGRAKSHKWDSVCEIIGIGRVGSSFKKDWANNSDITEDFASVKEERAKRYAEIQKKAHLISDALEKGDYSQPMTFEESREEENKRKLKDLFNSSNSTMMSFNDAVILPDDDLSDIEDG